MPRTMSLPYWFHAEHDKAELHWSSSATALGEELREDFRVRKNASSSDATGHDSQIDPASGAGEPARAVLAIRRGGRVPTA